MLSALLVALVSPVPAPVCALARTDGFALDPLYGAAAASDGGNAYVFGGQGGGGRSRDLLVFDAEAARPERRVVQGATARRYHAIAVRGQSIYVVGGEGKGGLAPFERIDLFFSKGMEIVKSEIVFTRMPNIPDIPPFASDHSGVVAVFRFK